MTEMNFEIGLSDSRTQALNHPWMTPADLFQLGPSPGQVTSFTVCLFGHLSLCPSTSQVIFTRDTWNPTTALLLVPKVRLVARGKPGILGTCCSLCGWAEIKEEGTDGRMRGKERGQRMQVPERMWQGLSGAWDMLRNRGTELSWKEAWAPHPCVPFLHTPVRKNNFSVLEWRAWVCFTHEHLAAWVVLLTAY